MAAFASARELKAVFGGMLQSFAENDPIKMVAGSGIVMRYETYEPAAVFVIDASVEPRPGRAFKVLIDDPQAPEANVSFRMSADALDALYTGTLSPMAALSAGKIEVSGNQEAALRLLPAMFATIPRYKQLKEQYAAAHR